MGKSAAAVLYQCSECGWRSMKWAGRCGECQGWGTVAEARVPAQARAGLRSPARAGQPIFSGSAAAVPITDVDASSASARPTGLDELDLVLGGGLVPGAVVLLAGEPGVGKSTLLLEAGALAAEAGPVLYVTGEESAAQVKLRADRIGAVSDQLYLAAEPDLSAGLLIVDSVQTINVAGVDGTPGGVTQIREVTAALMEVAKQQMLTTVLVGHVTKDGSIAGPRALEHLVDVVLHFDGDRHSQLRMVRALKNRFGPTDEIGCFELGEYGLIGLADPSGLFLSPVREPVPGPCVTVALGTPPACRRGADAGLRIDSGPGPAGDIRPGRLAGGHGACRPAAAGRRPDRQAGCLRRDRGRSQAHRAVRGSSRRAGGGERDVGSERASAPGRHRRGRPGRRDPPGPRDSAPAG
jgi:DNA repair protein RadA/Sms